MVSVPLLLENSFPLSVPLEDFPLAFLRSCSFESCDWHSYASYSVEAGHLKVRLWAEAVPLELVSLTARLLIYSVASSFSSKRRKQELTAYFWMQKVSLLVLLPFCFFCWLLIGEKGGGTHRDTYIEQQQTEKIETEVRDVDRIRITNNNLCTYDLYGPVRNVFDVGRYSTLCGQVLGGWALEMESFLGPVKWHQADRRVPFGAQITVFSTTKRVTVRYHPGQAERRYASRV